MATDALLTALYKEVESLQQDMNGRIERIKAAIEQEQRKAKTDEPGRSLPGLSYPKSVML